MAFGGERGQIRASCERFDMNNQKSPREIPEGLPFHGKAGIQSCGDWCRHFEPLDEDRWPGYGRCLHPLSLRRGEVFIVGHECTVGEAPMDLPPDAAA